MNKHLNIGSMRNKFVILVLSVSFLTSCFKDKGNYDYTELAEITIENIPETVEVLGNSGHIVINPKVISSLEGEITEDNPNFEFSYRIENAARGEGWFSHRSRAAAMGVLHWWTHWSMESLSAFRARAVALTCSSMDRPAWRRRR